MTRRDRAVWIPARRPSPRGGGISGDAAAYVCSISSRRWPGDLLVHVRHERHAEQRRRQIQDRDRHERRDEGAGQHDRAVMPLAQRLRLLDRMKAHRGEQEIFAAEQVAFATKKIRKPSPANSRNGTAHEIDEQRQQRGLHALDAGASTPGPACRADRPDSACARPRRRSRRRRSSRRTPSPPA